METNVPNEGSGEVRHSHVGVVAAVVAVIAILVGGGVFAYQYFAAPKLTPDQVIERMQAAVKDMQFMTFDIGVKVEMEKRLLDVTNISGNGLAEMSDMRTTTIHYAVSMKGMTMMDEQKKSQMNALIDATVPSPLGGELKLGLETRVVNGIQYLQLTTLPDLALLGIDTQPFLRQWVSIDPEKLNESVSSLADESSFELFPAKSDLTTEQENAIKAAWEKATFFKTLEEVPRVKGDAKNLYHYRFVVDEAGLEQFIKDVFAIVRPPVEDNTRTLLNKPYEEEVADILNETKIETSGEIWIGKKDYLPYRVTLNSSLGGAEATPFRVFVDATFGGFNEPFDIAAPIESKPIETFTEEIFGNLLGGGSMDMGGSFDEEFSEDPNDPFSIWSSDPEAGDADLDGIPDDLEAFYGTDPEQADTDGDGFLDGAEVEKGYNPAGPGKL